MNYYTHHIGDYSAATAHLTFIEDAAYSRLLRIYYRDERPLPSDPKLVTRMAGARTKEERQAVATVLQEFFVLCDAGWKNKRADEEIFSVNEKRTKARRSAEIRWNARDAENERNADSMRTHEDCKDSHDGRNALQSPISNLQSPEEKSLSSSGKPMTDLLGGEATEDPKAKKLLRLAVVASEAISSFNASPLVKANGGLLASISESVGKHKRQQQVARCLTTAREICLAQFGSTVIQPQFWSDYWLACHADNHKSGRSGGGKDHPNWKPTFEYLTRESTMLEIYDRAQSEDVA